MGMTKKERNLHEYIRRLLKTQGYKTYAKLFNEFDLNITDNPEVSAFMEPGAGRIVVNSTLDESQISTIIRHEILHQYLKHETRLLKKLADDTGLNYEDLDELSINELKKQLYSNDIFNIAADYEISNRGYTKKDKENVRALMLNGEIVRGLVTEDDHPDWVNLSVEEMFDKLMDEPSPIPRNNESVVVVGFSMDDMTFVSAYSGVIYDGTLYDPELDKNKKRG